MKLNILLERVLTLALSMMVVTPAFAVPSSELPPELLEAEIAFQASARFLDTNTVELNYQIADGYYLYRERFKFSTPNGQPTLGSPRIPAGEIKQDATFGRVETYRKSVRLLLPLANPANDLPENLREKFVDFQATSQGCADAGVCYPPLHYRFRLIRGTSAPVSPLPVTAPVFHGGAPSSTGHASPLISELVKTPK
jgi:thiol:disulfide interchange protein DsbD